MQKLKLALIISIAITAFSYSFSFAAINPNYGTTTYFSETNEMPSPNPPIIDRKPSQNKDKDKDSESKERSLFGQIIVGIGDFFENSDSAISNSEGSLFDFQGDSEESDNNSLGYGDDAAGFMGARGEAVNGDDDIGNYNSKISKFNFNDKESNLPPKRSKLIFTNIIVPVNLTTQYVLISIIFLIAIGSTVGYYLYKKDAKEEVSSKENYD